MSAARIPQRTSLAKGAESNSPTCAKPSRLPRLTSSSHSRIAILTKRITPETRWVMDVHAVTGSRMVPMSRFTGRLSFTVGYHRIDALGAINRIVDLANSAFPGSLGEAAKTREIIGTYADNYKQSPAAGSPPGTRVSRHASSAREALVVPVN